MLEELKCLNREHPGGFAATRPATSRKFRHAKSDAIWGDSGCFVCSENEAAFAALKLQKLSAFSILLILKQTAIALWLFPLSGGKVRGICGNSSSTLPPKNWQGACRGIQCVQGLLLRAAKSPARPSGTNCHCGFNSSVQPFPVSDDLPASVASGAGT